MRFSHSFGERRRPLRLRYWANRQEKCLIGDLTLVTALLARPYIKGLSKGILIERPHVQYRALDQPGGAVAISASCVIGRNIDIVERISYCDPIDRIGMLMTPCQYSQMVDNTYVYQLTA